MSTGDYFSNLKTIDTPFYLGRLIYLPVDTLICNLVSECQLLSVLLYILDIDEGTKGDGVYVAK